MVRSMLDDIDHIRVIQGNLLPQSRVLRLAVFLVSEWFLVMEELTCIEVFEENKFSLFL